MKGKLVGFNRNTIYRVHIDDQNKSIRVKNLQIFEDTSTKTFSALPDFYGKPTFDAIQIPDEQGPSDKSSASENEKNKPRPPQKPKKTRAGRDAKRASKEENEPNTTEKPTMNQMGRILEPSTKMQDEAENATNALIITLLLKKNWEEDQISAFLTTCEEKNEDDDSDRANPTKQDPLHILAAAIYKVNIASPSDFSSSA